MAKIKDELFEMYKELKIQFRDRTVGYFVNDIKDRFTLSITVNGGVGSVYVDFENKPNPITGVREINIEKYPIVRYKEATFDKGLGREIGSPDELKKIDEKAVDFVNVAIEKIDSLYEKQNEIEDDLEDEIDL